MTQTSWKRKWAESIRTIFQSLCRRCLSHLCNRRDAVHQTWRRV